MNSTQESIADTTPETITTSIIATSEELLFKAYTFVATDKPDYT